MSKFKINDIVQGDKFIVKNACYGMKKNKKCKVLKKTGNVISMEYCQKGDINNPKDELYNAFNTELNFLIKEFNLIFQEKTMKKGNIKMSKAEPASECGEEGWQPKCSPDDAYISGDINDLREMKSTYTYCPKCGKEIDFKSNEI